jgi:hypothetical protein
MQSNAPRFPDWFVPDCPPIDAAEASGTVYRFVGTNPPRPEEFQSYHETGELPNAPPCQRCGLSVFRKVEDVRRLLRHLWKTYPRKSYGPQLSNENYRLPMEGLRLRVDQVISRGGPMKACTPRLFRIRRNCPEDLKVNEDVGTRRNTNRK